MKKLVIIVACLFVGMSTACSSFSNMSEQDAYDVGYGLGTAARYLIDN